MSDWKDVWDGEGRATKEQLRDFSRNFVIDFTRNGVRGALPNGNLAPLQLNNNVLFTGILELANGGTNANLSGEGPGVLRQDSMGAAVTVGPVVFTDISFSGAGSNTGEPLLYDSGSGTADFGPLPINSSVAVTGVLNPTNGGTGVNNASRTLTLTGASATITGGGTLALGGFTLTAPATGTAALLGVASQAFTESNSFAKILHAHVTSGTTGYGIRVWDGTNDWGNFQGMDLGSISYLFFGTNRYYDGTAWQQFNTRVGSSFQVAGDKFTFYSFAASSSTPVPRFTVQDGFLEISEITAPAAGAANTCRLFVVDSGAGKTILKAQFSSGAAQTIATQP